MRDVLKMIASLSLSSSLLILALFLLKPLYKYKLSKRWQYYIWLVVIARLLLPFTPKASFSGTLFKKADQMVSQMLYERKMAKETEVVFRLHNYSMQQEESISFTDEGGIGNVIAGKAGNGQGNESESKYNLVPTPEDSAGTGMTIGLIWLGIGLILLVRKVTIYQSFVRYVRAGGREVSDVRLLEQLTQAGERMGIKRPVDLCINELVSSPMLLGLNHPCIVLLNDDLQEKDFEYIVCHELVHLKRGDMLYKWLVQFALCLHWFNPLVYLMGREINRACELSCDEAVVCRLDVQERRAYGDMLFRAMGTRGGCRNSAMSVTLNESVELLKERLSAIMNFKKSSKGVIILTALLTFLITTGAVAMGAYASPGPKEDDALPLSAAKDDEASAFRYTQEGYYQEPYLFEIGWNVRQDADKEYAGREILMPDGSPMTVLCTDGCKKILEDMDMLASLTILLTRMYEETAGTEFPFLRPLVVSVQKVDDVSTEELAEIYYQENSLAQFAAVFAELDEKTQARFLEKCYLDENIPNFSVGVGQLKAGSPLIDYFAKKAYDDDKIAFFSVLTGGMDTKTKEEWADRAAGEGRVGFRSMLLGEMGKTEELDKMEENLEKKILEEYKKFGITREGAAYYYQGSMVGILLDSRPNSSFVRLEMNPEGTANIRITRDDREQIVDVGYMTEDEIKELFGDMNVPDDEGEGEQEDCAESGIRRMTKEQLPERVMEVMNNCAVRTWYVIRLDGCQYLYYKGGWEYAYKPERTTDGWEIKVVRARRRESAYFLLLLPDEAPVTVKYNGEEAALMEIEG